MKGLHELYSESCFQTWLKIFIIKIKVKFCQCKQDLVTFIMNLTFSKLIYFYCFPLLWQVLSLYSALKWRTVYGYSTAAQLPAYWLTARIVIDRMITRKISLSIYQRGIISMALKVITLLCIITVTETCTGKDINMEGIAFIHTCVFLLEL